MINHQAPRDRWRCNRSPSYRKSTLFAVISPANFHNTVYANPLMAIIDHHTRRCRRPKSQQAISLRVDDDVLTMHLTNAGSRRRGAAAAMKNRSRRTNQRLLQARA